MGLFDFNFRKPISATTKVEPDNYEQGDIFDIINMRAIDLPIPTTTRGADWVLLGPNHSFPKDLIDYKNNSSLHASIMESEALLVAGNGILFAKDRASSDAWIIENFKLVPFWRKLDSIFTQVSKDQVLFGYSCFEVIYSMDRTRIVDMNWVDASRVACGKIDDACGRIEEYYYSDNWANTRNNPPKEIEAFNTNEDGLKQLMFIKYDTNNMDYYSLPDYYAALKWIKADGLMASYTLSAIKDGFSPRTVVKFFKKPTPEERRMNSEALRGQNHGPEGQKIMIMYSDGKELAPEVTTIESTNIDQRMVAVGDQIVQQIVSAHRCHPALVGIPTGAKLGSSTDIIQSWFVYNTMVIKPTRKLILDAFKEVLVYNGVTGISIEEVSPIDVSISQTPKITTP